LHGAARPAGTRRGQYCSLFSVPLRKWASSDNTGTKSRKFTDISRASGSPYYLFPAIHDQAAEPSTP
jgi:hypothetical protein